ncbi:hypothetical protein P4U03_29385 [Bacillus mycoides]|uniref:Uncharacterized protein n=4 Tax=Bacteria TaxID=2 RepID=A0A9W5Q9P3_BACCE|nr:MULTISPECIES: hypothetical protein [Bacteria]EJQ01824.1 hypothetical protein IE3_05705 [Bacillus cereus BAG3X2-1]MBD2799065.1 hypothetical protein [Xenorhabdus sp. M]MCQ3246167.1 hypothetical protein [Salmonella enterica subsp. enterica serovar Indiana]AEA19893.1 hypothetical protein CT43_P851309 [Bacillus thuringiensis serovar chinensis CT-43]AFV22209.1 hypothetical protein BTB_9p00060 [Bacillus thuringiensis Bt407]
MMKKFSLILIGVACTTGIFFSQFNNSIQTHDAKEKNDIIQQYAHGKDI